jgi:DNA-binding response OmpR family regulator
MNAKASNIRTPELKKRILVVEEDLGLRMVIESELVRAGYHVELVASGIEAIAKLSKDRYDLAIFDALLPGKSGLELLQFVRDRRMQTRVIVLTGMDALSTANRAMKLGADDFIPKPFDAEYLLHAVKMALWQKR